MKLFLIETKLPIQPTMLVNYRRTALDRDSTFYIPKVECFACYDSGLVSNGDNLVNRFIPDYDRDKKADFVVDKT